MNDAGAFLAAHPSLAEAMRTSAAFDAIRRQALLDIDGERLYIVRGDTLGSEEELFVEALVRGARGGRGAARPGPTDSPDPGDPDRALYLELTDEQRALVDERVRR
jgi:hypothetical protein